MKALVSIPAIGAKDVVAEWDGKRLTIPEVFGDLSVDDVMERMDVAYATNTLIIEMAGSHGSCGCGKGEIFFPPMCQTCWEGYADANSKAAEPDHTTVLALPSPKEPRKPKNKGNKGNIEPDKWDPKLLEGWSWDEPKTGEGTSDGE